MTPINLALEEAYNMLPEDRIGPLVLSSACDELSNNGAKKRKDAMTSNLSLLPTLRNKITGHFVNIK